MRNLTRRDALGTALIAGALSCVCTVYAVTAPELILRLDGDFLHVSAPRLNFLSGKPLQRLKDGSSVAFFGQLTISPERNSFIVDARTVARFGVSRDIWDEKFAVVKIGDRPESRRLENKHLSSVEATQNWCLDNLTVEQSSIPADRPFYVQLDVRTEDPQDQLGIVGDAGINISRLIEIFSRPPKESQRWLRTEGPFRLADLRKAGHG